MEPFALILGTGSESQLPLARRSFSMVCSDPAQNCLQSPAPTERHRVAGPRGRDRQDKNVLGVVDLGGEGDLGRLEGVVGGEGDGEEEDAARVWAVRLGRARESTTASDARRAGEVDRGVVVARVRFRKPGQLPFNRRAGNVGRTGPMIVACHWNMLSPVGPAEHDEGGSRPRSRSSSVDGDSTVAIGLAKRVQRARWDGGGRGTRVSKGRPWNEERAR